MVDKERGEMRRRRRRPPRALLRAFAAVAEAVLPEDGAFAGGAASAGCAQALERAWPDLQPAARRGLAAMLLTVEAAALLRTGRRLAALPPARRTELCDRLEHRAGLPWRPAFAGVKTLVLVLSAADPGLGRHLGVAGMAP
jgi:hypothetical protein